MPCRGTPVILPLRQRKTAGAEANCSSLSGGGRPPSRCNLHNDPPSQAEEDRLTAMAEEETRRALVLMDKQRHTQYTETVRAEIET